MANLAWPDIVWNATKGSVQTTQDGATMGFTAPSNAATAKITVTVKGQSLKVKFKVVEPSGVDGDHTYKVNEYTFAPGVSGAGMYIRVYVAPTDVSFYRVQCLEVGENATSVTGYYTNTNLFTTNPASYLSHSDWGGNNPFQINPDNSWEYTGLNLVH